MVQDADYVTDPLYPHLATQGLGLDRTQVDHRRSTPATPPRTPAPRPTWPPAAVAATGNPVFWGYNFQVTGTVQNLGTGDAGPVRGRVPPDRRRRLAQQRRSSSANDRPRPEGGRLAGHQPRPLQLPNRLPNGVTIPSVAVGRIAVVVDPDNTVDETPSCRTTSPSRTR